MKRQLDITIFGSSIVSAYWNGAATYYRGIARALHERGHRVRFFEPDAFDRQAHRDIPDPPYAEVIVYEPTEEGAQQALEMAAGADLVAKASGVGVLDVWLERAVLALASDRTRVAFWDVDAPATLDRCEGDPRDPFRPLIGAYDMIFTYGGGEPVVSAYRRLGARRCIPIYNALDASTHHPVAPDPKFAAVLGFLGNRLPDREARVESFFLEVAAAMPEERFILGGSGWEDKAMPDNVERLGHVSTEDHNAFNCTPTAVLNINRESMARYGFSPPTRVFEAAGAGACLITDAWRGIEQFLEPGEEVLLASSGEDVSSLLRGLTPAKAARIGERARARVLADHTYAQRALDVEAALERPASETSPTQAASESKLPAADEGVSRDRAPTPPPTSGARQTERALDIVILGLSITSSWGNGHATTYRALVRELERAGHRVLFLERDVPWYAQSRDMPEPPYGRTELYRDLDELKARHAAAVRGADCVIVGSYVPDGCEVTRWALEVADGTVAFYDIDTPVTLAALERGDCEYLDPALLPRLDLFLSFSGGRSLDCLTSRWGARLARPLYCSVDPELYAPEPTEVRFDLGYLGTYSPDRQPPLERLCLAAARAWPEGRFVVAGPQYPPETAWPDNVTRIDHVAPASHRAFYNSQRFTLNVTRADMIAAGHCPSVRLFEAAACGTPLITDRWDGLSSFFEPGEEILIADDTREVMQYLQMPAAEARAIGERARERVLGHHTARHRAAELTEHLREASCPRPRRMVSQ